MKGLDQVNPVIEAHDEDIRQNELRFMGSIRKPHKGMTFYEFNYITGDLKPAQIAKTIEITDGGQAKKTGKIELSKDSHYFWALNEKSAAKKLLKLGLIVSLEKNE